MMRTILCYGDSNTYGYDAATAGRFPRHVRWPGVLQAELGPDFEIIEEGLNGRTTTWDDPFVDGRNGRQYLGPCLQSHAPIDIVVLMLGTNDLKAVFRVSAPEIASGAGALIATVQSSRAGPDGAAPLVLLVAPPLAVSNRGHAELWGFRDAEAESRRFAGLFAAVAEEARCELLDAAAVVTPSVLDGVHIDSDGHRQLGCAIAERVRQMLAA